MSTAAYLAAAAVSGVAMALLAELASRYVAPSISALRRRWLEGRLSRRLTRGSDRYFEERRTIETALADAPVASRKTLLDHLFHALGFFVIGMLAINAFVADDARPKWSDSILLLMAVTVAVMLRTLVQHWNDPEALHDAFVSQDSYAERRNYAVRGTIVLSLVAGAIALAIVLYLKGAF